MADVPSADRCVRCGCGLLAPPHHNEFFPDHHRFQPLQQIAGLARLDFALVARCDVTAFDMRIGVRCDGPDPVAVDGRGVWIFMVDQSPQRCEGDRQWHHSEANAAMFTNEPRFSGLKEGALLAWDDVEKLHAVLGEALRKRREGV